MSVGEIIIWVVLGLITAIIPVFFIWERIDWHLRMRTTNDKEISMYYLMKVGLHYAEDGNGIARWW